MFKKKIVEEVVIETKSEKEILLELYKTLKDLGINSISDLENKISNIK